MSTSKSTSKSYPYISPHGWDQSEPILAWFQNYTDSFFDTRDFTPTSIARYHTTDFAFSSSGGVKSSGRDEAWQIINSLFGPFKAHYHEPYYAVVTEKGKGEWFMLGFANAYFTLPGEAKEGEKGVTSKDGRKWDVCVPSGYRFSFREDEKAEIGGLMLSGIELYNDSMPVVSMMKERGLM